MLTSINDKFILDGTCLLAILPGKNVTPFCITTKTTQPCPQVFSVKGSIIWQFCCMIDVISSHITEFFQIWSTVAGYDELNVGF